MDKTNIGRQRGWFDDAGADMHQQTAYQTKYAVMAAAM